jgi:hypothetical protein
MRRRTFLRSLGGAAAGLGLGTRSLSADGALRHQTDEGTPAAFGPGDDPAFGQWCWVHGGGDRSPEDWLLQFRRLRAEGFSGVLVGGGDTEILARAAHENGLEFHRWIWTLNRNGDEWVKANHPEWFTVSRNLESSLEVPPYVGYYRWLCPTKSAVREYLQESILEIAQDPRVDGIRFRSC